MLLEEEVESLDFPALDMIRDLHSIPIVGKAKFLHTECPTDPHVGNESDHSIRPVIGLLDSPRGTPPFTMIGEVASFKLARSVVWKELLPAARPDVVVN
jgi:hypothetical protein